MIVSIDSTEAQRRTKAPQKKQQANGLRIGSALDYPLTESKRAPEHGFSVKGKKVYLQEKSAKPVEITSFPGLSGGSDIQAITVCRQNMTIVEVHDGSDCGQCTQGNNCYTAGIPVDVRKALDKKN